jgi:hypothetical protein
MPALEEGTLGASDVPVDISFDQVAQSRRNPALVSRIAEVTTIVSGAVDDGTDPTSFLMRISQSKTAA